MKKHLKEQCGEDEGITAAEHAAANSIALLSASTEKYKAESNNLLEQVRSLEEEMSKMKLMNDELIGANELLQYDINAMRESRDDDLSFEKSLIDELNHQIIKLTEENTNHKYNISCLVKSNVEYNHSIKALHEEVERFKMMQHDFRDDVVE